MYRYCLINKEKFEMKNKFRQNDAITLIAMVITIIILLILAGVGIQALTNTGLFEKTK